MSKTRICWVSLNGYSWLQIGRRNEKFTPVISRLDSFIEGRVADRKIFGSVEVLFPNIRQSRPTSARAIHEGNSFPAGIEPEGAPSPVFVTCIAKIAVRRISMVWRAGAGYSYRLSKSKGAAIETIRWNMDQRTGSVLTIA